MADDPTRPSTGPQDILLLSDGDDPVGDDEWARGIAAARAQKIPVYDIGIWLLVQAQVRDPICMTSCVDDRHAPSPHASMRNHCKKLPAAPAALICRPRPCSLVLGRLFRDVIEPCGRRQASDLDSIAGLRPPRQHYPDLLAPALVLLAPFTLIGDRNRALERRPSLPAADEPAGDCSCQRAPLEADCARTSRRRLAARWRT